MVCLPLLGPTNPNPFQFEYLFTLRYNCWDGMQFSLDMSNGWMKIWHYDDDPQLFMFNGWSFTIKKKPLYWVNRYPNRRCSNNKDMEWICSGSSVYFPDLWKVLLQYKDYILNGKAGLLYKGGTLRHFTGTRRTPNQGSNLPWDNGVDYSVVLGEPEKNDEAIYGYNAPYFNVYGNIIYFPGYWQPVIHGTYACAFNFFIAFKRR